MSVHGEQFFIKDVDELMVQLITSRDEYVEDVKRGIKPFVW